MMHCAPEKASAPQNFVLTSAQRRVRAGPWIVRPKAESAAFRFPLDQEVIRDWLGKLCWPRGVRVAVDVDPYSFLRASLHRRGRIG
jgi:hypothetical protein